VKVVGATTVTVFQKLGAAADVDGAWSTASASLNAFAGQTVRILIEAADASTASLVEAAVDDLKITQP
jgi:aminopeptidase S